MTIYTKTGATVAPLAGSGSGAYERPLGISRQWQRGDGITWSDISGETGTHYTVVEADRGFQLRLVEYDYNLAGAASASSVFSSIVGVARAGSGTLVGSGQGATALVYAEAGSAVSVFTGKGLDADTFAEAGKGISPRSGRGADVDTSAETGKGVAPLTGGGARA